MINLIPQYAKKKLQTEYWIRAGSVWLILWGIALILGACLLLPVYVLVSSQVDVYTQSANEASLKVAAYEDVSAELQGASQQARWILSELEEPLFSDWIDIITELEGDTIQINKIEMSREDTEIEPIEIIGIAADRHSLAAFRDRILAESWVDSVDLPISNLAQDRDIDFSIIITLVKEPAV